MTDPSSESTPRTTTAGWRSVRRYGPLVAVLALVAAAVVVFGGGDDGGSDDDQAADGAAEAGDVDRADLVRRGPMTPERAELEGVGDVDFGPNCDEGTGQIRLPTVYAPPCVEPFDGDNQGATYPGVTEDTVKVVAFLPDPALDPLGAAAVGGLGADLDPETGMETMQDYLDIYNELFETYGRTVELEFYTGTGESDDQDAARADAVAIAEREPFAVIGAPLQAREVFADTLVDNGVVCAPGCALAMADDFIAERDPLVWNFGPTANQASQLAAAAIGNLAGPGPAELAGDEALQQQDRVYAAVYYTAPESEESAGFDALETGLSDHGIELEVELPYLLDLPRVQENARSIVAQLEEAGVTTVIFYGDPLMPQALTTEATAQEYFPEWILGPNLLADTALFGRSFDQEQWGNGFGLSFAGNPGVDTVGDSYLMYDWAYGREPPSNIYAVLDPGLRTLFTAIHMAGPELKPETFRDGLLRLPPGGGGPTRGLISYGNDDLWPSFDYGGSDDVALIWWDPEAQGADELGQQGPGMYRFANGGQRYTLDEMPSSAAEAGLFDTDASVIELTDLPADDRSPDYPSPDL
ncbi:MAG: hypothetical protein ACRD2C_10360 [Acidimicrobiales bacterium]